MKIEVGDFEYIQHLKYSIITIALIFTSYFMLVIYEDYIHSNTINEYISLLDDGLAFTFHYNLTISNKTENRKFTILGEDNCLHSNDTPTILDPWKIDKYMPSNKTSYYVFYNRIESNGTYYGISVLATYSEILSGTARNILIVPCNDTDTSFCATGFFPYKLSQAREACVIDTCDNIDGAIL